MEIKELAENLHPLERKIIPFLSSSKTLSQLVQKSGLQEVEAMRALQWLENKNCVKINSIERELISLGNNGKLYMKKGLPERRMLEQIKDNTKSVDDLMNALGKDEFGIAIGILKQKAAIMMSNGKVSITDQGKKILQKQSLEETFITSLSESALEAESLSPEQKFSFEALSKRKEIVEKKVEKIKEIKLTELGKQLVISKIEASNLLESLTPELLKTKKWKGKKFRKYDVKINVPEISSGRRHPLSALMEIVRDIFVEMGFQEMTGPWVETSFWCLDSMWVPQDHPARDVQDTYYLPLKGDLPDKELVKKVKAMHEHGGKIGSKGHQSPWNPEVAKQLLLRTHTTATTYRKIHYGRLKDKETAKNFYIGRVFRNEAMDATHLPEFHHVEGFVMADGLSLKHLMGFIKEFYAKMGIHEIKFKVTYNPYTESSLEALYYDKKGDRWIELINSGMFRPESLAPYGIKKPIIAWGLGVERLAMILYKTDKLKDLLGSTCDLDWLKNYLEPIREE